MPSMVGQRNMKYVAMPKARTRSASATNITCTGSDWSDITASPDRLRRRQRERFLAKRPNRVKRIMICKIRPIELRDVAACQAIVRDNWDIEAARRFAAEVSHVWSLDLDEEFKPQYFVATNEEGSVVGFAGMIPSWIMHRVWDFIWINVAKSHQRQGIGRQLTEHRIMKVIAADGRVIQLMTKDAGFFGRWFTICRDYREEGWKLMTLQLGTVAL
jgi:GNAT superfamily N-acetyltransferase